MTAQNKKSIRSKRVQKNPLSHEARELALYIENDGDLYRQQTTPIILNLARKIKRGIFSHTKAAKLFRYLADNGAKKYSVEFGTPQSGVTRSTWRRYKGFDAFSAKVRQETAKHLLRYYFQAIREKARELGAEKNPIKPYFYVSIPRDYTGGFGVDVVTPVPYVIHRKKSLPGHRLYYWLADELTTAPKFRAWIGSARQKTFDGNYIALARFLKSLL